MVVVKVTSESGGHGQASFCSAVAVKRIFHQKEHIDLKPISAQTSLSEWASVSLATGA